MAAQSVSVKVAVKVLILLAVVMTAGTYYLVSREAESLEQQLLARGRMEAVMGAKFYGKLLEEAIDNGALTMADAFDTGYQLIPGFEPPKYHTKYDFYTDKAVLSFIDEVVKDESVVYAVGVDVNGYLPTHNSRYQQPISGDREKDKVGNRTKRIFSDTVGAKAASNVEEGYLQIYKRDTGETMWDISSPIHVKGKHWGGFRIGFSLEKTAAAKQSLLLSLLSIMGIILAVSAAGIVISVNNSLRPLKEFTKIASDLAEGKVDKPIVSRSKDEIGVLADVLERVRMSLKAAMDRLSR